MNATSGFPQSLTWPVEGMRRASCMCRMERVPKAVRSVFEAGVSEANVSEANVRLATERAETQHGANVVPAVLTKAIETLGCRCAA